MCGCGCLSHIKCWTNVSSLTVVYEEMLHQVLKGIFRSCFSLLMGFSFLILTLLAADFYVELYAVWVLGGFPHIIVINNWAWFVCSHSSVFGLNNAKCTAISPPKCYLCNIRIPSQLLCSVSFSLTRNPSCVSWLQQTQTIHDSSYLYQLDVCQQ